MGLQPHFKDFWLTALLQHFLTKLFKHKNKTAIVFGATSGDTGSAAIDACKDFGVIKSFILIPHGNMSEIQKKTNDNSSESKCSSNYC